MFKIFIKIKRMKYVTKSQFLVINPIFTNEKQCVEAQSSYQSKAIVMTAACVIRGFIMVTFMKFFCTLHLINTDFKYSFGLKSSFFGQFVKSMF